MGSVRVLLSLDDRLLQSRPSVHSRACHVFLLFPQNSFFPCFHFVLQHPMNVACVNAMTATVYRAIWKEREPDSLMLLACLVHRSRQALRVCCWKLSSKVIEKHVNQAPLIFFKAIQVTEKSPTAQRSPGLIASQQRSEQNHQQLRIFNPRVALCRRLQPSSSPPTPVLASSSFGISSVSCWKATLAQHARPVYPRTSAAQASQSA